MIPSPNKSTINLGNITVDVELKKIKNIHMRIYSQDGRVYMSVPEILGFDGAKEFALKKIDWINKNLAKFSNRTKLQPLMYITGEQHFFFGEKYALQIIEKTGRPVVSVSNGFLVLKLNQSSTVEQRKLLLEKWYRKQLELIIPGYISKWEPLMNVRVKDFGIRKMKTKWGVCDVKNKIIRVNLELGRRHVRLLEYIIVHEMVHLLERRHNKIFYTYMNHYLPGWRLYKAELNRSPVQD
mgnify:CR=1 FL=1